MNKMNGRVHSPLQKGGETIPFLLFLLKLFLAPFLYGIPEIISSSLPPFLYDPQLKFLVQGE